MKCRACGQNIPPNSQTCWFCGRWIDPPASIHISRDTLIVGGALLVLLMLVITLCAAYLRVG